MIIGLRAPDLVHATPGTLHAAAAIAAADAADRLLDIISLDHSIGHLGDAEDRAHSRDLADSTARELCGYAALAAEPAIFFLREIAKIYRSDPDRDRATAEAITLLDQVSSQRRAA